MLITGYKLKEVLKLYRLELSTKLSLFGESLHVFEGEEKKESPLELVNSIDILEQHIARIEAAQSEYNLRNKLKFHGLSITLEEAIKHVGGAGRISKMWRNVAKGEENDRYSYGRDLTKRDKNEEYAKATITKKEALELAKGAERSASELRSGIAVANSLELNIETVNIDFILTEM